MSLVYLSIASILVTGSTRIFSSRAQWAPVRVYHRYSEMPGSLLSIGKRKIAVKVAQVLNLVEPCECVANMGCICHRSLRAFVNGKRDCGSESISAAESRPCNSRSQGFHVGYCMFAQKSWKQSIRRSRSASDNSRNYSILLLD